jgi:hypothetical protein
VITVIVSVTVAAIVGLVTVLSGSFGDTEARILGSTSLVAGLSITSLCHLAIVGRAIRVVGFAGLAASAVAFVSGLVLVWGQWADLGTEAAAWLKVFALAGLMAVFLSQTNLLLLLARRTHRLIRIALAVTLGAIASVYVLLGLLILTDGDITAHIEEVYFRGLAVVSIVDALGTVVLPVLGLALRRAEPTPDEDQERVILTLLPETAAALRVLASSRGTTVDGIVAAWVAQDSGVKPNASEFMQ